MTPTILLFDIDDTLITSGGAGRRALERAFVDRCGPGRWLPSSLAGLTDRAIVREALEAAGRGQDGAALDDVLEAYLRNLVGEVAHAEGYAVHAGVEVVLAAAARRPRCALGLGTGNLERGARIKLARGGLDRRFGFGGFGSDHELRPEILRIGAERGAALLGRPRAACRVVAIGDTPRDVAAALAIGAECVGVATGEHSVETLRAAGAAVVFPSLAAPGAVEAILGPSLRDP